MAGQRIQGRRKPAIAPFCDLPIPSRDPWPPAWWRLPGAVQVGLPSAFLQAGAAHVVASLWQVGDEAAIDLMRDFFRALSRSDPVRALAAAQRARIDDPPATWAGYVIFSDGVRARPYARLLLEGMTRLGF